MIGEGDKGTGEGGDSAFLTPIRGISSSSSSSSSFTSSFMSSS